MVSERVKRIKPSATVEINAQAIEMKRLGHDIIGLSAGESDFPTPDNICSAAKDAIDKGKTGYTACDGIQELKRAIQIKYEKIGTNYEINEIIVSAGGKDVIFNALMSTLNDNDEVIIPAPFWVSYPDITLLAGGKPVVVECSPSNSFKITPQQLEESITPRTRWFILNSPNNPSGAVYSYDEMRALADVLLKHPNVLVLTDEIYEHMVYPEVRFYSFTQVAPELKGRTLVVNGVSKSHSMTGWRIGFGTGPKEIIGAMKKIQSQSTTCACSISQWASVEALTGNQDFIVERLEAFRKRRDKVVSLINDIPNMSCINPYGAFYLLVSCEGYIGKTTKDGSKIDTDEDFVKFLLKKAQVALVHGYAFGAPNFFRISYAASDSDLEIAISRIRNACINEFN